MGASEQISDYIAGDWRGDVLGRLRELIVDAAPGLTEEWKWKSPVWSSGSNVVSVGAFEDHVKVSFFNGAALEDPAGLFNAGLDAKASRSIDLRQGDTVDEAAFQDLVREAVARNAH